MATQVLLAATVATLAFFAWTLPWTRLAVAFWFATLVGLIWLDLQPGQAARLVAGGIWVAWLILYLLQERAPLFAWGSAAERHCQEVMLRVSREAREAYLAGRLDGVIGGFVADLDGLEPPPGLWQAARDAQLLDLRATPPQVGVGAATDRLAPWPWRLALDSRTVALRIRLDDAVRRRRSSRLERPSFDDLPSDQRYDSFFLRILAARFKRLMDAEGGLAAAKAEAAALIELGREVAPPDAAWAGLRDLVVERLELELRAATGGLGPDEQDRLRAVAEEAFARWRQLEQPFFRGSTAER